MANTLATIRIGVLGLMGDVDELVATSTTDTLSLSDVLNLSVESGTLIGRYIIFDATGANAGQLRRVQSNDKETATIVFNSAVPDTVEEGLHVTMINYRSQGVSKSKVDRAINDAIRDVRDDYLLPTVIQTQDFDYTEPIIAVGSDFKGVAGVDVWADDLSDWLELDPVDWTGDRWARTISLMGRARFLSESNSVRIRGYALPELLVNDDDETLIDYEWLRYQATSNLHFELARRRMDPQNNERWGQYYGDKADERRAKVQMPAYSGMVFQFY
jgi:hypothetical protein